MHQEKGNIFHSGDAHATSPISAVEDRLSSFEPVLGGCLPVLYNWLGGLPTKTAN